MAHLARCARGALAALGIVAMTLSGWGQARTARSRAVLSQSLPELDGRHLKAIVVEVTYGPGESSHPHSHPCPVIGYVVEGAVRMQVKGERGAIYRAGESFYEAPHGVHEVSANASQKGPARFIAYFVCDHDEPLSTAVPTDQGGGKR